MTDATTGLYTPLTASHSSHHAHLLPSLQWGTKNEGAFLFFVFPSRPLPLTPPGRPLTGISKTLGPGRAKAGGQAVNQKCAEAR